MSDVDVFNKGDVVRVKSGGPKMTVADMGDYTGGFMILCVWFEGNKKFQDTFYPSVLEKV
jgi:uncharacterized protein YodC (DUF2158 family)